MGASGSAWIKPTKRSGLRAEAMLEVPHPRWVRKGQRFFPRRPGPGGVRVTVRVTAVGDDGRCTVVREDFEARVGTAATSRLLAVGPDGAGSHYRFVGFVPRSGYDTHAYVVAVERPWARLVLPEWHPALVVTVAAGELPAEGVPGAWLRCRANLGAGRPVEVVPARLKEPARGFDPSIYPAPDVPVTDGRSMRESPSSGAGCGDVVLYPTRLESEGPVEDLTAVYVTGHSPPVAPGGRAYLSVGGRVIGWREVSALKPLPNGMTVAFSEGFTACEVPTEPALPMSGVAGGEHGAQQWCWRDWERAEERTRRSP